MSTWPEHPQTDAALDAERARVVARLRTEVTEGRISLEQFSDLVGDAFAARGRTDLERVTATVAPEPDVSYRPDPAPDAPVPRPARPGLRPSTWLVAVFGDSSRRGRYRLDDETTAAAVFGECVLDLTSATITSEAVAVNAIAVFGDVTVIVPEGIEVVVEGASIFGSRRCDTGGAEPVPGSPVVKVRAWACFGEIHIRPPKPYDRRVAR